MELIGSSSSVGGSKDNMARIKAGKITASLYGSGAGVGDKLHMYADSSKFNRLNDYYYDGGNSNSNSKITPMNASNQITIKTENNQRLDESSNNNNNNMNRTNSLFREHAS